jgi:hypothetical protein
MLPSGKAAADLALIVSGYKSTLIMRLVFGEYYNLDKPLKAVQMDELHGKNSQTQTQH